MAEQQEHPQDLTGAIRDSADGPARVVIDGQVSEEHPLPGQIAADNRVAANSVARRRRLGPRFIKMTAGGSVQENRRW